MIETPTRRRVLRTSGIALGIGLAGCIGGTNDGASGSEPQTTEAAHEDHGTTATEDSHHDSEGSHHEESGHESEEGHDDGDHSHEVDLGDPVEHATVRMVTADGGYHFEPHVVRVKPGGTVTFVNESGSHSATAYHSEYDRPLRVPEDADPWDSGLLTEQGAEFEHAFETDGVYDYYCTPHEGMGMIGSIIVGDPDPHDQPGLAAPQESLPGTAREKITSLNERCNEALGHSHDG